MSSPLEGISHEATRLTCSCSWNNPCTKRTHNWLRICKRWGTPWPAKKSAKNDKPKNRNKKNKTYTLSAQSRETRLTIRIRKEITRRVMTALIGNCPHSHERQEKEKKNSSQKFVAFFVPQTFISAVGVIRVRDGATIRQGAANIQAIRVLHQPANAVSRRATSHVACGHTQVARSGSWIHCGSSRLKTGNRLGSYPPWLSQSVFSREPLAWSLPKKRWIPHESQPQRLLHRITIKLLPTRNRLHSVKRKRVIQQRKTWVMHDPHLSIWTFCFLLAPPNSCTFFYCVLVSRIRCDWVSERKSDEWKDDVATVYEF